MKTRLEDLALFGGKPTFAESLHVGRPNVGDRRRLLERFDDLLDRFWFTNDGPYVQELEQRIAELVGVEHCIATANGTMALEIAVRAANLGGEVIVPSFTFVSTPHALQWQGITPVFCDIDPDTHNLDPAAVEAAITPRTSGIVAVHLWGRPCDVEKLTALAQRHGLKLIFDAAHALACSHQGRMLGGFGDAEVLSFHATKFVNSFEGGAVVTTDEQLASNARLIRNFGFSDYDTVVSLGTNGKMSEVSAAMGLTSLESMEEFIEANHRNYVQYQQEFADVVGVSLVTYNDREKCNYQHIVLEIDEERTQVSRDQLKRILWAENVLARRYFYPGCHRMEPYQTPFLEEGRLPHTDRVARRVLSLPTGTSVGREQIAGISEIVRLCLARGDELTERLRRAS